MERNMIELEEGWEYVQAGITKLKRILEGQPEPPFDSEHLFMLYTTIYNMCNKKHFYPRLLYDKYRTVFEEYINSTVLPVFREKHDEYMLQELVKRWFNHKVMVTYLSHFFGCLESRYISSRSIPTLNEVALTCFRSLVYCEFHFKVTETVKALINKEREGQQIDRALLKNVLDIYIEIDIARYEEDFESLMLQDTASYYSHKASIWIQEDSCPDYMLKCEECLKQERERVTHYLHSITEPKLIEIVQHELLIVYVKELLEKEHSGCRSLLRYDKVDDLSRMYRLYIKTVQGLEHVANIFKQHLTAEVTALVQQDGEDKDLFRKLIELHYKYMMIYVTQCFENHALFHEVLKESFDFFRNKKFVGGISSGELLATFRENSSHEAFEDLLNKAFKLIAYIYHKEKQYFSYG